MVKALKNFGVAFLISAIIIGIAAMIILNSVDDVLTGSFRKDHDDMEEILNPPEEETPGPGTISGDNTLSALDGDSFSVLAVMTDYRPEAYDDYLSDVEKKGDKEPGFFEKGYRKTGAEKICIVKCSKETGKFLFVPLSPLTKVSTAAGPMRLYDVYTEYGIEYMKAKIEAETGIAIDRYAVINCTEISSLVAAFGAVWCSVPCEIYTDGTEYVSATAATAAKVKDSSANYTRLLEVCEDYIGPSSMGLLLFKDYSNGIDDEIIISSGYMKGCAANFKKLQDDGVLTAYWSNLAQYFKETNVDAEFMTAHAALIGAYSDDIAKVVNPVGMFREVGDDGEPVFELDLPRTIEALESFR